MNYSNFMSIMKQSDKEFKIRMCRMLQVIDARKTFI